MKKIIICGYGYVGIHMYQFFKGHYDVYAYDPFVDHAQYPDIQFINSIQDIDVDDLSVMCVPTPRGEHGECDISIVQECIGCIKSKYILLKSTCDIGTTRRLSIIYNKNIVFSPEYCGESTYWSPYAFDTKVVETPFFIFGGDKADTSEMIDIFMPIGGPTKKYIQCTFEEAEMTKYMENSFYATKIAYCYEMNQICKKAGIDWNTVRELWLMDPRINPMHTAVFAQNDYPFSGKCLPKDTSAICEFAKKIGYEPELLKEVLQTNERINKIRANQSSQSDR